MNKEAYELMMRAEVAYLIANGWVKADGRDAWSNSKSNRHDLPQGRAVNTQKQFDRNNTF